jgi:hypothetical protein
MCVGQAERYGLRREHEPDRRACTGVVEETTPEQLFRDQQQHPGRDQRDRVCDQPTLIPTRAAVRPRRTRAGLVVANGDRAVTKRG